MSGLEIAEAVDTCNNPHSADAMMPTDKDPEQERTESDISASRPVPDTLVEFEAVVHELHALGRQLSDPFRSLLAALPDRLCEQILKLLSKDGLEEVPTRHRQEARMMILEAIGICLANAMEVNVIETDVVGEVELSSSELEALYRRRLDSSASLEWLLIRHASEKWEPESWRLLTDMLLRAESLSIRIDKLSLSGLSKLAEAVAASGRGPLLAREVRFFYTQQDLHRSERTTGRFIEQWAPDVANLIAAAPGLKTLGVVTGPFTDDEGVGELIGEVVASHQSLETLEIIVQKGGRGETHLQDEEPRSPGPVGRLLSRAFLHRCNTSINSLTFCLCTTPSTADLLVLSQVLQMSIITKFELSGLEYIRSRDICGILTKLQLNGHMQLQSLGLFENDWGLKREWGFDRDSFAMLVDLLKSNSMRGLKHLDMGFRESVDREMFNWSGFYTSLSQMESVSIRGEGGYRQAEKEITEWIQGSKRLQKLRLSEISGKISWKPIFKCLRDNNALRILTVDQAAKLDDDTYRELLESLQVNCNLQEINFSNLWLKDNSWKAVNLRAALSFRASRENSYLVELRKGLGQGEWRHRPTCGRIFLCGPPEAGKTRLAHTMLKLAKTKKSLLNRTKEVLLSTERVNIHTLKNDDFHQIFVWDLECQDMFQALQQILFPSFCVAPIFIFVFSPCEPSGELKLRLQETFQKELLRWLRLIASNSSVTIGSINIPQVIVVISHKTMWLLSHMNLTWSFFFFEYLIRDFQDIIDIFPYPFFIDCHEPQHVRSVLDTVYNTLEKRKGHVFQVPLACSQLSRQFHSQISQEPIIDDDTFFNLCRDIPDLQTFSDNCHENANKKLLKAVGSYLHDVGTVIDMSLKDKIREKPKSNLMVVDLQWLTIFIGHLTYFRHEFHMPFGEGIKWKGCENGILSETDFQQFLLERFKVMMEKFPTLTSKRIQDLMERLDLLYVTEVVDEKGLRVSRFFSPAFFKGRGERAFDWASHSNETSPRRGPTEEICFFGIRLCCEDQRRTCLSPAFFNKFQVVIWRKLIEELKEKEPVIEIKFNLISIIVDGLHILVENDEDGDFIDVMVKSTKTKTIAWNFVEKYIVKEVRELCASPKGCPGVELFMKIIRTECVKVLTPCKDRKNQSVSREELRTYLLKSIQKLGLNLEEEDLYRHTWTSVPTTDRPLTAASEKAVELLPQKDIESIIDRCKKSLQNEVIRLEDMVIEIDIANQAKHLGAVGIQTNFLQLFMQMKSERSKSEQFALPMHEKLENLRREIHQDLEIDLKGVGRWVKEVFAEVEDLKVPIQELIHLRRREEKNLSLMYQKLDELMDMGHSMSPKEWSKMLYVTQGDLANLFLGQSVSDKTEPKYLNSSVNRQRDLSGD